MSMAALKWAREPRPGLGGPAIAVLRDLADRANDSGVCWPSVATICADTGLSRRTVQRALRKLEQHKLLEPKQITGRSSRYILQLPASERRTPCVTETPTPASVTPKASISTHEAKEPWLPPTKQNSAAYRKADLNLPDVDADPAIVEQLHQMMRRWR